MNSAPPPMTSRRSLLTPDSLRATLRVVDNPIDPAKRHSHRSAVRGRRWPGRPAACVKK
ncbi:MAG: hypothetical protein OEM00_03520 [Burkholderiaceae bacterium]|nr:hypothetical protein [Burkholderiaceae bacterium]